MKIEFKWEDMDSPHVGDYTQRAKVIGGWVLRTIRSTNDNEAVALIFIADPLHTWIVPTPLHELSTKSIYELEFSVRTYHCLEANNVNTIGDLVTKTECDLLRFQDLGKKSLCEIKNVLANRDLKLGMKL